MEVFSKRWEPLEPMQVELYTLYGTAGCHLCEIAEQMLVAMVGKGFRVVEIAEDQALLEQYGLSIPVLQYGLTGQELCWPFDSEALREWFVSHQAGS